MKIFLSYSRTDTAEATAVAEDVQNMGHSVWYDQEVDGGQAWWDVILHQIREGDVFIFILTLNSLDSPACRAEYKYAAKLCKRILPILCGDGVKDNLLPPQLSQIQYVDYRGEDKRAAYAMMRAFSRLQAAESLPDPLPAEPDAPVSYLGELRDQILSAQPLTPEEQQDIFNEVRRRTKYPESREDALGLLALLRKREYLMVRVADQIDRLLEDERSKQVDPGATITEQTKKATATELPPSVIKLSNDSKPFEIVARHVAATSEHWVLEVGDNKLFVRMARDRLTLDAIFQRWTGQDAGRLKELGWNIAGRGLRVATAGAISGLGLLTYGLGFGIFAHKGTRDYVSGNTATKSFSRAETEEVAAAMLEVLQILDPDSLDAVVKRVRKSPDRVLDD